MSVSPIRTRVPKLTSWFAPVAHRRPPLSEADRNAERLLTLLGDSDMTISQLRDRGVRFPAQGLYDLQLAGYPIERIRMTDRGGGQLVTYRLAPAPTTALD
jgi:hypothetical protein